MKSVFELGEIRGAIAPIQMLVEPCAEGSSNDTDIKCIWPGKIVEFLHVLAQSYHFNYTWTWFDFAVGGTLSNNGTWNGRAADLLNDKFDIAIAAVISSSRIRAVDYT